MNNKYIVGETIGAITRGDKTVLEQHEHFCINHWDQIKKEPKPVKMKQVLVEEIRTTFEDRESQNDWEPRQKTETKWTIYGWTCLKCHQYVMEGEIENAE